MFHRIKLWWNCSVPPRVPLLARQVCYLLTPQPHKLVAGPVDAYGHDPYGISIVLLRSIGAREIHLTLDWISSQDSNLDWPVKAPDSKSGVLPITLEENKIW